MIPEYEYVLISNSPDKVLGRFWFDGRKIRYSNSVVEYIVSQLIVDGKTHKDKESFLRVVDRGFRNGYMSVKKVKKV